MSTNIYKIFKLFNTSLNIFDLSYNKVHTNIM